MSDLDPSALAPHRRWAKGQSRPRYLQPDDIDRMMMMTVVAPMSEVPALRDRLDTHEAVADLGETATTAAIETHDLSPERHLMRETNCQSMLTRVLRTITEEREAATEDRR